MPRTLSSAPRDKERGIVHSPRHVRAACIFSLFVSKLAYVQRVCWDCTALHVLYVEFIHMDTVQYSAAKRRLRSGGRYVCVFSAAHMLLYMQERKEIASRHKGFIRPLILPAEADRIMYTNEACLPITFWPFTSHLGTRKLGMNVEKEGPYQYETPLFDRRYVNGAQRWCLHCHIDPGEEPAPVQFGLH